MKLRIGKYRRNFLKPMLARVPSLHVPTHSMHDAYYLDHAKITKGDGNNDRNSPKPKPSGLHKPVILRSCDRAS
jgi:hypothetical protein